jgi:uncharacterized protein (TIGR00725 family)
MEARVTFLDKSEAGELPARLVVGVMGSASGRFDPAILERCTLLGRTIADRGCTLVTGACPGLPQAAVQGARSAGGLVVGISPALSRDEHIRKYDSPVDGFDVLIYTGSGLMGREVDNIRTSDIVVIAGGSSGTLGEFAIAYDEGRLIGVLTGTGGMADHIADMVHLLDKPTGAQVLFDDDPLLLIDRLIAYYRREHYKRPNCYCEQTPPKVDV